MGLGGVVLRGPSGSCVFRSRSASPCCFCSCSGVQSARSLYRSSDPSRHFFGCGKI